MIAAMGGTRELPEIVEHVHVAHPAQSIEVLRRGAERCRSEGARKTLCPAVGPWMPFTGGAGTCIRIFPEKGRPVLLQGRLNLKQRSLLMEKMPNVIGALDIVSALSAYDDVRNSGESLEA
jgi:hypothetical protein